MFRRRSLQLDRAQLRILGTPLCRHNDLDARIGGYCAELALALNYLNTIAIHVGARRSLGDKNLMMLQAGDCARRDIPLLVAIVPDDCAQ